MAARVVHHVSTSDLSTKQRLALVHNTDVDAQSVLGMDISEFTVDFIVKKHIPTKNMRAAGLGPCMLLEMGVKSAAQLRTLGFDPLDLCDSKFASEAVSAFGARAVVDVYLLSASDAVSLTGSNAAELLGIRPVDLLNACAGAPVEASSVLQQLPPGISLTGVPAAVVLDTGLRKNALMELGYSLTAMATQTGATADELQRLGFSFM